MLAPLNFSKKKGLSTIVVCPKGRHPELFQDVAMEERPNAQDRKIPTVWQAIFSSSPQADWLLPFCPLLAGSGVAGRYAWAAEHEETRSLLPQSPYTAVNRILFIEGSLECTGTAGRDGDRHLEGVGLEAGRCVARCFRRHAEAKARQIDGGGLQDISARREGVCPRSHDSGLCNRLSRRSDSLRGTALGDQRILQADAAQVIPRRPDRISQVDGIGGRRHHGDALDQCYGTVRFLLFVSQRDPCLRD